MNFWKLFLRLTGVVNLLVGKAAREEVSALEEDLRAVENLQRRVSLSVEEARTLLLNRHHKGGASAELLLAITDLDAALDDKDTAGETDIESYLAYIHEELVAASSHIHKVSL